MEGPKGRRELRRGRATPVASWAGGIFVRRSVYVIVQSSVPSGQFLQQHLDFCFRGDQSLMQALMIREAKEPPPTPCRASSAVKMKRWTGRTARLWLVPRPVKCANSWARMLLSSAVPSEYRKGAPLARIRPPPSFSSRVVALVWVTKKVGSA